jgi:hypothetical protein
MTKDIFIEMKIEIIKNTKPEQIFNRYDVYASVTPFTSQGR